MQAPTDPDKLVRLWVAQVMRVGDGWRPSRSCSHGRSTPTPRRPRSRPDRRRAPDRRHDVRRPDSGAIGGLRAGRHRRPRARTWLGADEPAARTSACTRTAAGPTSQVRAWLVRPGEGVAARDSARPRVPPWRRPGGSRRGPQERADGQGGYGAHFARLMAEGVDIEGEARLADALAPRQALDPRRRLRHGPGRRRPRRPRPPRGRRRLRPRDPRPVAPDLPRPAAGRLRLDELTPEKLSDAGQPDGVRPGRVCRQRDDPARARHRAHGARQPGRAAGARGPAAGRLRPVRRTGRASRGSTRPPSSSPTTRRPGSRSSPRFASYDLQPFTDDSTYVVHVLRRAA